jgi:hypothetical protein
MKPDDFEQRLQRQPPRRAPAGWRDEILQAAEAAAGARLSAPGPRPSWLAGLLRPWPVAWAGLAAVWVVSLGMDFSARDRTPSAATATPPPAVAAELQQQRRLLTELLGQFSSSEAEPSKPSSPQPRSERTRERLMA